MLICDVSDASTVSEWLSRPLSLFANCVGWEDEWTSRNNVMALLIGVVWLKLFFHLSCC